MSPSQPVLALGIAIVCASGCVWYLPALADVRAGADRPRSHRLAAVACLTAWSTAALAAAALLLPLPWHLAATVAATGASTGMGLRLGARRQRAREEEEARQRWAALLHEPVTPPAGARPRLQRALLACLLAGVLLASASAALVLAVGMAQ